MKQAKAKQEESASRAMFMLMLAVKDNHTEEIPRHVDSINRIVEPKGFRLIQIGVAP